MSESIGTSVPRGGQCLASSSSLASSSFSVSVQLASRAARIAASFCFVLGIFFVENEPVLSDEEQLRGTWLELATADPKALEARLLRFGVKPVPYTDPSRLYFQAPGGPVFRVAPLDGAL